MVQPEINEDDNFFPLIFEITKLSLNVELDRYCDLWSFLHKDHKLLLFNFIIYHWELIENPQNDVYKTKNLHILWVKRT